MRLPVALVVATLGQILIGSEFVCSQSKESLNGLVKFCLDSEPDGVALISRDANNSNSEETLILFKVDKFWAVPTGEIIRRFDEYNRVPPGGQVNPAWIDSHPPIISELNELKSQTYWKNFPAIPQYVISFTGLNSGDNLTNTVLVFKDTVVHRYLVKQMHLRGHHQAPAIQIELIGQYQTNIWHGFPRMPDLEHLIIPRSTKILLAKHSRLSTTLAYVVNSENLESPVEQPLVARKYNQYLKSTLGKMRFYYELERNRSLIFLNDGGICLDSKCILLREMIKCSSEIQSFTESFSYWLWRDTDLTMRLVIVALSTVLVINIILGLAFIIHQTDRVSDLT